MRFSGGRVRGAAVRETLMCDAETGSLAHRGVCRNVLVGSRWAGPLLPRGLAILEARFGPAYLSSSRKSVHYGNARLVAPVPAGRTGGG